MCKVYFINGNNKEVVELWFLSDIYIEKILIDFFDFFY